MHHTTTHQPVAETFTNSLCRDIGHDWKPTPVSNYRLCQRGKCKAAQRLYHGRWTDVTARPARSLSLSTEQASMTWAPPEPTQRGA
jgi:hypothetical protein